MERPHPPAHLFDALTTQFEPAPELDAWVRETVISESGALYNPEHYHLEHAVIGYLWTNVANVKRHRRVLGQAEIPQFMCGGWQRARQEMQITTWFGIMPDFIITLDALYCSMIDDAQFCALVEHELYHCAQQRDAFGAPKFSKSTGRPVFELRGHDVEEFVGVVRRYGTGGDGTPVGQLVQAGMAKPEVKNSSISIACGTCIMRAA